MDIEPGGGVLSIVNSVGPSLEITLHLWGATVSPIYPPFQSPYKIRHIAIFRLFVTKSGINLSPQLHVSHFDLYFFLTQWKKVFQASVLYRCLLALLLLQHEVWRSFCYPVPRPETGDFSQASWSTCSQGTPCGPAFSGLLQSCHCNGPPWPTVFLLLNLFSLLPYIPGDSLLVKDKGILSPYVSTLESLSIISLSMAFFPQNPYLKSPNYVCVHTYICTCMCMA